jgi:hypothetical protein
MKTNFFVALLTVFACLSSFAQSDTTIRYYGKNGRETNKDSAVSYVKFFKQANMWHGVEYYMKRASMKSEGVYNEMNLGRAVGTVSNYKEDGKLDYESEYADGKILNKTYYYNSGKKKSYTAYSDKGVPMQKGWDENGKELKDFVIERAARFKGGEEGWKKYLEKNLNASLAADLGLPPGSYDVQLQFVVNRDGILSNLKAVSVPAKCKPCGAEALRVLRESPEWEPAILNNEPVLYPTTQTITFNVQGDKKKG